MVRARIARIRERCAATMAALGRTGIRRERRRADRAKAIKCAASAGGFVSPHTVDRAARPGGPRDAVLEKEAREMELAWWHWMVLGLGLSLAELVVPSFFIIWFGLGALLVGVAMLAAPAMAFSTQILLWTVASVLMTVLWFRVFRKDGGKTRSGQANEALGEIGVLVRAVEPLGVASARGEVRFQKPVMGSDVWPCLADEAIAAGERVRVLAVDGQLLKVGKY